MHFGFSFEVAVVDNYFSYRSNSQQFVNVSIFVFQQQHSQLITYFHRPVIFPDLVDFPNDLKFSARNFHFPVYQQSSSDSTFILNCSKEQILFYAKISYSQQVHEPAYMQVEYNSYVLVGGIGSLLLYCISSSVSLNYYYRSSMCH